MNDLAQIPEDTKILATIGHVCLQWAQLEMALLAVIYAIESIPPEKGELIYGGLDMIPRVNMAIRLAGHDKQPLHVLKRLRAVRKALQDGLSDRRNQVVHGAHHDLANGSVTLTMVRWRGDKRQKVFTALDIGALAEEIFYLADETWKIFETIGEVKFGPKPRNNGGDDLGGAKPLVRRSFAERLNARIKRLFG